MRLVHAAALTAAALLLASVASAQGIGDAAAREREKRKAAPAKPAKVYTEGDIGPSIAPASATQELPADASPASQPAAEGGTAPADAGPGAKPAGSEEDAKAKAEAEGAWRQALDQARKEEAFYKDAVDKTQLQLNDTSGMYSSSWTAAQTALEDYKQKLAQAQGKVSALEAEGRRNSYR
jgi:hypothetical protein